MKRKLLDVFRAVFKIPALEKVLVYLTTGKKFGSLISRVPPNNYQYPQNSRRIAKRDGLTFHLDISDLVDWYVYYGFQDDSRSRLYDLIREGFTVLDVGANIGDVTLHAAAKVGVGGRVVAVEPDPVNFKKLQLNCSSNPRLSNIVLLNHGLGDAEEELSLITFMESNRGMNRIGVGESSAEKAVRIRVRTIDHVFQEYGNRTPDLIKIDVEGFELRVLRGARQVIERCHPILFIEVDDNNLAEHGDSALSLLDFLESYEYSVYNSSTMAPVTKSQDFTNCHFDIVALWKGAGN